jgi:hypothetical protein
MNKRQDYRDYGKAPFGTIAGYFRVCFVCPEGSFSSQIATSVGHNIGRHQRHYGLADLSQSLL